MALFSLSIAGIDRTGYVQQSTVSLSQALNSIDALAFTATDKAKLYRPDVDEAVLLYDSVGALMFGGLITDTDESDQGGADAIWVQTRASGWAVIWSRRIVNATYENMTLRAIVTDINTRFLDGEGFTLTHVDVGPTIAGPVVFSFVTVQDAFAQLAQLTGYDCFCDPLKDIHFSQFVASICPLTLTDGARNWKNLHVRKSSLDSDYCNVQYLRTNSGIGGVTAGEAVVRVEDAAEIAARAAITGGSGKVERIDEAANIEIADSGTELATGLLNKRKDGLKPTAEWDSYTAGWAPGQMVTALTAKPLLAGDYLIQSVTTQEEQLARWKYHISVARVSWTDWWAGLARRSRNAEPVTATGSISIPMVGAMESSGHFYLRTRGNIDGALVQNDSGQPITLSIMREGYYMKQPDGSSVWVPPLQYGTLESGQITGGRFSFAPGTFWAQFDDMDESVPAGTQMTADVISSDGTVVTPGIVKISVTTHPHSVTPELAHFILGESDGTGPQVVMAGDPGLNPVPVYRGGFPVRAVVAAADASGASGSTVLNVKRISKAGATDYLYATGAGPTLPAGSTGNVVLPSAPNDFSLDPGDQLTTVVESAGGHKGVSLRLEWRRKSNL